MAEEKKMIEAVQVSEVDEGEYKLTCPHCGNVQQTHIELDGFDEDGNSDHAFNCPKCNKNMNVKVKHSFYTEA